MQLCPGIRHREKLLVFSILAIPNFDEVFVQLMEQAESDESEQNGKPNGTLNRTTSTNQRRRTRQPQDAEAPDDGE